MDKDCSSCVGDITIGPWGNDQEGNEWSFKTKQGVGIKQIIIRHGLIIDSLLFKANTNDDDYSTRFGGEGGDFTVKIDLDYPSEFLTGISGTYTSGSDWCFPNTVWSLTFHTNKTQHGPFGETRGTAFSSKSKGGVVTGFHGRCGQFLEAIGLYIMPLSSLQIEVTKKPFEIAHSGVPRFLLPPRSAAAFGGDGGRDWDDGVFAAVKAVHLCVRVDTGVVSAVRFSYLKSDASAFLSSFHGGYVDGDVQLKTGSFSKMIVFGEEDEYLIGVEGFCGAVEGGVLKVITSLSFVTNKGKYGPVGAEIGDYFSSINSGDCNKKVVGFHGRSGAYLDAIGLHTEYF